MNTAMVQRQLPGWKVWKATTPGRPARWVAVPAPAGESIADAINRPGRVDAPTAPDLIALAQARYGWDDTCDTCGVLARECGHRQPETRDDSRRTR